LASLPHSSALLSLIRYLGYLLLLLQFLQCLRGVAAAAVTVVQLCHQLLWKKAMRMMDLTILLFRRMIVSLLPGSVAFAWG
jgi:hypothetical protein